MAPQNVGPDDQKRNSLRSASIAWMNAATSGDFSFALTPAYRCAHAGYLLAKIKPGHLPIWLPNAKRRWSGSDGARQWQPPHVVSEGEPSIR
jgi:hypothetical protein